MVLAKREEVESMNEQQLASHLKEWKDKNFGQEFGYFPLVPCKYYVPDVLHLFLDHGNCTVRNAFHQHLLAEDYQDKDLQAMASEIRDKFNTRLSGWMEQGGAGLMITMGHKDKKHALNGPKLKAMMHDGELLADLCLIMKPLYDLKEAKYHKSVQKPAITASEHKTEAEAQAARLAAELTAAAGVQEEPGEPEEPRKRGQKKKCKRGANLQKPKAKRVRAVVLEEVRRPEEEQPLQEEEGGGEAEAGEAGAEEERAGEELDKDTWVRDNCTYYERVCLCFLALAELWSFVHQNELNSSEISTELRKQRAEEAARLAVEAERAYLLTFGTGDRRTYVHDAVYGLADIYMVLGKPYLASCEGNEHAHQRMKAAFHDLVSKSAKRRGASLQVLDILTGFQLRVHTYDKKLPGTKWTSSSTGLTYNRGPTLKGKPRKQHTTKRHTGSMEESKARLATETGLKRPDQPASTDGKVGHELKYAKEEFLDPQYKLEFRS